MSTTGAQLSEVKKNSKFVASWGYDQTQYSIYNVVEVKGKFVLVEGRNGWSRLGESDLAAGSKVKLYTYKRWDDLSLAEKEDWTSRGFTWDLYNRHMSDEAKEAAEVRTITKANRIDGESWTYIWQLDNGEAIRSDENSKLNRRVEIIKARKRCLVNTKYHQPSIRINNVITAYLDPDYERNREGYEAQNEYTNYNGR